MNPKDWDPCEATEVRERLIRHLALLRHATSLRSFDHFPLFWALGQLPRYIYIYKSMLFHTQHIRHAKQRKCRSQHVGLRRLFFSICPIQHDLTHTPNLVLAPGESASDSSKQDLSGVAPRFCHIIDEDIRYLTYRMPMPMQYIYGTSIHIHDGPKWQCFLASMTA